MITVELDVFSGRPNPTWTLPPKDEEQLVDMIVADPSLVAPDTLTISVLGYRGFIVRVEEFDDRTISRAKAAGIGIPGVFRIGAPVGSPLNFGSERWLLTTAEQRRGFVSSRSLEIADVQIAKAKEADEGRTQRSIQTSQLQDIQPMGAGMCCVDNYLTGTDYTFWNGTWTELHANNCYNFAANYRVSDLNIGFAVPGLAGGQEMTNLTVGAICDALRRDGWSDSCTSSSNITICFAIAPGTDFHFYRLVAVSGSQRVWGNKPGCTLAATFSCTDPESSSCNRGAYTTFGEYFYAPGSRVVAGHGTPYWCR